jgi:hypothetical protein
MNLIDSFFNIDSFSRLLTFAIFLLAGYDLSKSVPRPKSPFSWIAFILAAIVSGYIGMEVNLISVSGFNVFLNEVILGLAGGFVVGFVIRMRPRFKMH